MKALGLTRLSKEKRTQLILVLVVTAGLLAALGFGLIKRQYASVADLAKKKEEATARLAQMQEIIKHDEATREQLAEVSDVLDRLEEDMASSDPYLWFITTLRRFRQSYNVNIPQVSQPSVGDVSLLPAFPYKQATLNIAGTASFYDLGKFIADLENQFPQIRLSNLSLEPASGGSERDMLAFRMDVAVLVKPNVP
jgi:Tfp pilus assembly protein PilO